MRAIIGCDTSIPFDSNTPFFRNWKVLPFKMTEERKQGDRSYKSQVLKVS